MLNRKKHLASQSPDHDPAEEGELHDFDSDVLVRVVPPWLISMLVHVALILILAILTLATVADKQVSLTVAPVEDTDNFMEMTVLEFDDVDFEQDTSMESLPEADLDLNSTQAISPVAMQTTEVFEFSKFDAGLGEMFTDAELLGEEKSTTTFFGAKESAQKVVFVVDNSNSMSRGKFETALNELDKTVSELTPKQLFHVIFFSDTAYLMFHPKPVNKLVPANQRNKDRLRQWLYTVEMCLKTKGEDAMKAAVAMQPDVIYILGDGAFTDKTEQLMTARHNRKIVVNTLGMRVNEKGRRQLTAIAKANKGKFRDVEEAPEAIAMAKRNPIKRNQIRGKVWGIKLPLVPKKKN